MSDFTEDQVAEVASKVTTLLQFAALLIPDMDMLQELTSDSNNTVSHVDALAPVIGAMGGNYDKASFEARLRQKRARALYGFVKLLKETEEEREKFNTDERAKQDALAKLSGLGLF